MSASPSTDTGLTFRLKPHTPTESKIVLTNTSGEFVAFKVRIKTQDNQKTRYRVSPNQGHISPNESTTVYVYIEESNVNKLLQVSCDSGNPVECNDKFLIMGVVMKQKAYEHFVGETEEAQNLITGILFDAKNKKSISKLKYDRNRFESAYWSKPLDEDAARRLARGADNSSDSSKLEMPATPGIEEENNKKNSLESSSGESKVNSTAVADSSSNIGSSGNENSVDTNTSSIAQNSIDVGREHTDTKAAAAAAASLTEKTSNTATDKTMTSQIPDGEGSSSEYKTSTNSDLNSSSGGRGITNGGAMPVEYEKMVNDLILLRNKYDSLLVEATKWVAQRDRFQEMFHRSRSEVIRVSFFFFFFH